MSAATASIWLCGRHPIAQVRGGRSGGPAASTWPVQGAGLIGLHFRDDDVDQLARQRQALLVIGHDVVWIVEQALGTIGKSNGQQIGVRPLAAAPFRVNDEVLDLKKTV